MTLIGENFPPPTGGMVQSLEPHIIAPNECAVAVDQVFHVPGELRSRGLFWADWNYNRSVGPAKVIVSSSFRALSPSGLVVKGGMGTNTKYLAINQDTITVADTWGSLSPPTDIGAHLAGITELYAWSAETTPQGVTLISGAPFKPDLHTPLTYMWAGSTRTAPGAVTGTVTYSTTSVSVTGVGTSFTTDTPAGTFLESGSNFIGIVKSVESNTALTLWDVPYNGVGGALATNAYALYTVRPRWSGGTITTRTTQTVAIGNGTRFAAFPTSTADQVAVFARNPNLNNTPTSTFLGFTQYDPATDNPLNFSFRTVGSATTTTALANTDGAYWFGYRRSGTDTSGTDPLYKSHVTQYANMYFYTAQALNTINEHRLYFSSKQHFADVDMSSSGSWINIPASRANPVVRIVGGRNCLMIFLRNDIYCLTGTSPENFVLSRVSGEVLLGPNAVCKLDNGVAWASVNGIFFFDGSAVKNLTERSFGNQFKNYHGVGTMYRQYGATVFDENSAQLSNAVLRIGKDYLFLSLNNAQRTRNAVRFPATSYSFTSASGVNEYIPVNIGIVVYLPTLAASIWTNMSMLDIFVDNEAAYFIMQAYIGTSSTNTTQAVAVLLDDLLDLTKFQYSDGGLSLADGYLGYHPNGAKPWSWGSTVDVTAATMYDLHNTLTTSSVSKRCLGGPYHGTLNMYEHRAKLTSLSGGAAVGSWTTDATFAGGGYIKENGPGIEQVISSAQSSGLVHGVEVYFPSFGSTGVTMLIKSGLFGWRITTAAGTALLESVGFTGDTSWTVSGVPVAILTMSAPCLLRAVLPLSTTGSKGIKVDPTLGCTIHWSMGEGGDKAFPQPYVQTKAVGVVGSQYWLRKLRMHYASTDVVGAHTISNNDGYRTVGPTWATTSFPSSGMTTKLEADIDIYTTQDIRIGRVAELWQFCLGLSRNTNNRFIWKTSQVFGKPRRSARN